MPEGVMIRGRYVSKNRPVGVAVVAIVMAIIGGVNLGIGINYYCWDYSWDSWCDYRRRAYIISGSFFLLSSVLFLVAAISLHLKIKAAIRRNQDVLAHPGTTTVTPDYVQPTNVYPGVLVAQYPTQYPPPATPTPYPPAAIHGPPPVGFAGYQQSVPPVASNPTEYPEYQRPPPYTP